MEAMHEPVLDNEEMEKAEPQREVASSSLSIATWCGVGLALLFWASAFPAIRVCVPYFPPGELALGRYLVASFVLGLFLPWTRPRLPQRRDVPTLFLMGLLGFSIYNFFLNYGEIAVTAGAASFLVNTGPVWAAVLAHLVLGERLPQRGWLGIAVSFAGATVIALTSKDGLRFQMEAVLILLAAMAAAGYMILQKRLLERYRPLEATCYAMWAGTAALLIFAPGLPPAMRAAPPEVVGAMIYMGIFPGALAYVIWANALSRLPAGRVASFLYFVPALTVALSWLWLREVPPREALAGGVLALAGVWLVNARERR